MMKPSYSSELKLIDIQSNLCSTKIKIVIVAKRRSSFKGTFMILKFKMEPQYGGRYRQVVVSSGLTQLNNILWFKKLVYGI